MKLLALFLVLFQRSTSTLSYKDRNRHAAACCVIKQQADAVIKNYWETVVSIPNEWRIFGGQLMDIGRHLDLRYA